MKKQVTLPIHNLKIFETLARGYAKASDSPEEMIPHYIQSMAKESYQQSFNASLSDLSRNPHTPRIAYSFYDSFPEIFDKKNGWFARLSDTAQLAMENARGFKSALSNIVGIYLGIAQNIHRQRKNKNRKALVNPEARGTFASDLEYPMRAENASTDEHFATLLRVERARYIQLFMATTFSTVLWKIMQIPPEEVLKQIEDSNLWNLNEQMTNRQKFNVLADPKNRALFVESVKAGMKWK